ncbi:glycosyltransferase family 4 protein [Flavobacterium humi]|uniref:Glycosyltransferase n=1 Tax=Flavobacterium humi TaxID=2562683 RepID=A0A4Z0L4K7_9FLAO|nr:glycosyltransferase family 4 protein [Flavobacterium humi]TGD57169.1 glycosyltransferase [Flavobacterium humi]
MYKKLTIVSDTAILKKDGIYYAFGPVVNELESFEHLFDEITWIGFNRPDKKDDLSMKAITSTKVTVIALQEIGGKTLFSSLKILLRYPVMFFIIFKNILKADVVHTRAPSHPAFIAVLISFLVRNKIWWHKFAGSWDAGSLPFFYRIQKNVLSKAKHTKVTINGFWENQPKHCLSFENPCLSNEDIKKGKIIAGSKNFSPPFVFSFVGRLENAKGTDRIIEALQGIPLESIEKVHLIGDGPSKASYQAAAAFLGDKVVFHGFLDKEKVHELLSRSHFLLLPSNSEGFPKAIAEGACYGAIPVVSGVGSISHYITGQNGFLWDINGNIPYTSVLQKAIQTEESRLKEMATNVLELAEKFTFDNYIAQLQQQLFN